jgi:hypothetical protein
MMQALQGFGKSIGSVAGDMKGEIQKNKMLEQIAENPQFQQQLGTAGYAPRADLLSTSRNETAQNLEPMLNALKMQQQLGIGPDDLIRRQQMLRNLEGDVTEREQFERSGKWHEEEKQGQVPEREKFEYGKGRDVKQEERQTAKDKEAARQQEIEERRQKESDIRADEAAKRQAAADARAEQARQEASTINQAKIKTLADQAEESQFQAESAQVVQMLKGDGISSGNITELVPYLGTIKWDAPSGKYSIQTGPSRPFLGPETKRISKTTLDAIRNLAAKYPRQMATVAGYEGTKADASANEIQPEEFIVQPGQ